MQGHLTEIWRYPVSSAGGERLGSATLGPDGVTGDRGFGFFDRDTGDHIFPTRDKRWNAAPQIRARLHGDRPELSLDGEHWAPADDPAMLTQVAQLLGRSVDLRAYGPGTSPRYTLAPLHLLSHQAITALQRLLPDSRIDARRFRPNLLVDLPDADGDIPEYALLGQEFSLGPLRLRGTVPCGRCGFTILPIGSLPEDPDVLRMLIRRFERNFGIYCEVIEGGELSTGARLAARLTPQVADPVIIVGGGQAGAMAARALRRLGYGGAIRIFAAERHLPYERPPLSKRVLAPVDAPDQPLLTAEEVKEAGITLDLATPVEAIDLKVRQVETAQGNTRFGALILATGGSARRVPGLSRGHGRVHELRIRDDAERLAAVLRPGARLFILGGGWIGMEIAAAARMVGAEVSLFARSDTLAPRILPKIVADALAGMHRNHGVNLHFGADPRFEESESGVTCDIADTRLHSGHLLVAIGMRANDGIARRAGLDCADGIVTDNACETGHAGVYAIGDVARPPGGRLESWQNANLQAECVARRIMGQPAPPAELPRFWSEQFGHRVQIIGRPDPAARLVAQSDRFWDFGDFAIGIERPEAIHSFARKRDAGSDTPVTEPAKPPVVRTEYRLCPLCGSGRGRDPAHHPSRPWPAMRNAAGRAGPCHR